MYVFLVVFHCAELKNKCFITWNCTVCPFSVRITTLEAFLRLNRGSGGMLNLEFFQKFFFSKKTFCSKIHFYQKLITFPLFFYFGSYWRGAGESWDLVIFPRFSIFYQFLKYEIMHIGGPLSFRLVFCACCFVKCFKPILKVYGFLLKALL